MSVHPTAVIAKGAQLGAACDIGPYCVIGPDVRLGDGCRLHSHVVVDGHTRCGSECEIFPFVCIGKQTQDLKFKGGTAYVEIGARTTLREYVTVHASTVDGGRTAVGDDCHLLAYCHIAHDCMLGNGVVMSNCCQLAGHVVVEDYAVFGGLGGVAQFVHIGRLSMIGATAKVVQNIVPFSLTDGNPAEPVAVNRVGMERRGFTPTQIQAVTEAHKILFRANLLTEPALARLEQELGSVAEVRQIIDFVRKSERGIARPKNR